MRRGVNSLTLYGFYYTGFDDFVKFSVTLCREKIIIVLSNEKKRFDYC